MEKQANALWSTTGRNSNSLGQHPRSGDRPFLIEGPKIPTVPQALGQPLHELFQEVARANPLAVALTFRGEDLSYDELNRRANRVAHRLIRMGVGPESLVGISIGRSLEFVVGLLAIVKAGGAYVPLDLSYPRERLNFMLRDTKPSVLLTGPDEIDVDAPWARTLRVTADQGDFSTESDENTEVQVGPRNAAYVMYTSGSTGNPKGVVIEQRSIVRLVREPNYITISPLDTFLQLAPTSFDASTLEIWGALLNGARLVIMEPGSPSLRDIGRKIEEEQVTTLWLTAGLFHAMVDEQLPALATVRNMLAGGDVLSPQHVERFLDAHRSASLINGYGPTEGTTFTCCHVLRYGDTIGKTVPIGRPISKTRVLILDEALNQVSIGQPGELYIGGEGVARGYLNQPKLTAERFVRNPYSTDPSDVLYLSGDLVSVRADGAIEFLGRKDNQVKIRGFRVELGEIEVALQQHPAVRHAVALVVENGISDKAIHAFWTAKAGAVGESSDVLLFAGQHLPAYMVPSTLTRLESLPLTENGKVDRKQLLSIAMRNVSRRNAYVPPSDTLEMQLIEIWEEALGVTCLGTHDDFFELGGHSLLAARMFAQIEQKLRKSLPLATMFHASTIQKLAEVIRAEGWTPYWSELVPIQPNGTRPPLFLVHGLVGNVLNYYGLRHHVSPDQPVYGLQAEGLSSGRASHFSIADMAAHYVDTVRSVQPTGPYYLGGFSAGGLVAYEMAQLLTASGEQVKFLALFDSSIDVVGGHWFKTFHSKRAKDRTIRALRVNFLMMRQDGLRKFARQKALNMSVNFRIMLWLMAGRLAAKASGGGPAPEPRFLSVREAFTRAIRSYTPSKYEGSAVLFRTHGSDLENPDPSNGWRNYISGNLEIHEVDGDHNNIFREPHIGRLSHQLIEALEAANAEHGSLQAK
jgi:aspartate racemase